MKGLRWLLAAALAVSTTAQAYTIEGKVVGISDGDTLTVLDAGKKQHKIRLADIDAPESSQPYGNRARQRLSELAFGKQVVADCREQDRYKRDVCTLTVDGTDVNADLVMPGSTASTTGAMTCRRSRTKPGQRPRVCGDKPRRKLLSPRNGGKAKKKYSCRYSKRNRKRAARQKRPSAPISVVAAASVTVARCVLAPRRSTTTVSAGSAVSTGTRMVFRVKSSAAIEAQQLRNFAS